MKKVAENVEYPKLTPSEFEEILKLYGMSKTDYCKERGMSPSWFYECFRAKQFVQTIDIETLVNKIGHNVFNQLVKEVQQCRKCKYKNENNSEEKE